MDESSTADGADRVEDTEFLSHSEVLSDPTGSKPSGPALGFPDIVLAGAARSGTSFLAARLSAHPAIDGGSVKEPNYFSRNLDKGPEWYDALFDARRGDLLRLDASMSYSAPQHPEALGMVAAAAPESRVIYALRDPLVRAVSHYRLLKNYFEAETARTSPAPSATTRSIWVRVTTSGGSARSIYGGALRGD